MFSKIWKNWKGLKLNDNKNPKFALLYEIASGLHVWTLIY